MVSWECIDDIAFVKMDDGKANAMNATFLTALMDALVAARSARAVVLWGRSSFFSGGLDLKTLPTLAPAEFQSSIDTFERTIRMVLEYPVPVVACLSGHALAGGAVLLLACDLAVAAAGSYKIGLNEVAIGIPLPEFVLELARLRLLPRSWTKALLLGQSFSPEEAQQVGFVDEVTSADELLGRATALAAGAARVPAESYRQTKALLYRQLLKMPEGQIGANLSRAFLEGGLGQILR